MLRELQQEMHIEYAPQQRSKLACISICLSSSLHMLSCTMLCWMCTFISVDGLLGKQAAGQQLTRRQMPVCSRCRPERAQPVYQGN